MLTLLSRLRVARYFVPILFLIDLVVLNAAILFSLSLTNDAIQFPFEEDVNTFFILSNVFWLVLVIQRDLYEMDRAETIIKSLNGLILLLLIHTSILLLLLFIFKFHLIFYIRLFYFDIIIFTGILGYRYVFLKLLKYIRTKGYNYKIIAIFGTNDFGNRLAEILSRDLSLGFRVSGFYDTNQSDIYLQAPYLGDIDNLDEHLEISSLDELYVCMEYVPRELFQRLVTLCDKHMIRIKFVPNFQEFSQSKKMHVAYYDTIPVINIRSEPLLDPFSQLFKRAFDIVFSLAVILLVFPWLFPIIMIAIKLTSSGPCFFKQLRSGEGNKSFTCYKFRTMYVNEKSDTQQASKLDSRITKVGSFLRKTNLDEFPQFLNVFAGSMSIVGPRPHMIKHTDEYRALLSNYLVRHFSKPGITGWAQVNGYRGETKEVIEMQNRVKHDIFYLENWSFLLDIKIIFLTVKNMIQGEEKAF
jgi:putative colanic acid biosynthesis UDP-glucose lipid carrier transferase